MDFNKLKETFKSFIIRLQGLNDSQKKIILWSVVGVLGVIMAIFWFKSTLNKLENINVDLSGFQIDTESVVGTKTSQSWDDLTSQINEIAAGTEDWQTYTNEEYGFEIKYPQDWIIGSDDVGVFFTTQELQTAREENLTNCNQGKECSAEFLAEVSRFKYIEDGKNYTSDDIVNGISQVRLGENTWTRYQPSGFYDNIHFRLVSNNNGYDFVTEDEKYENTLQQMLSTFKFIN